MSLINLEDWFKPVKAFATISLTVEVVSKTLPIPIKCDRCKHDIVEVSSFYIYCNLEPNPIREEHFCHKCLSSYKGFNGISALNYMDALMSGIEPLYQCRIKRD